jgi:hypothetical protein
VREHGGLPAQIGTHHQQRIKLVDGGNGKPTESGSRRIVGLVAEIRLTQAVIDVGRTQRACEFSE